MAEVQGISARAVRTQASSGNTESQQLSKRRALQTHSESEEEEYEVSKIVGEKVDSLTRKTLYLIRWKGYDKLYDSWEPLENLGTCTEALKKWTLRKLAAVKRRDYPQRVSAEITASSSTSSEAVEAPLVKKIGRPKGAKDKEPRIRRNFNANRKRSRSESNDSGPESASKRANSATQSLELLKLRGPDLRDKTLNHPDRLKFLENLKQLNGPEITVVNTVDMVPCPPLEFVFINDYVYREGVPVPNPDFNWGCSCKGAFGCKATDIDGCDCGEHNHEDLERLAYKHTGLLKYPENCTPAIHECNEKCACNYRCPNKVVLKGRQVPLEIFKTEHKGWGLRCPVDLAAGQFIDRYIGEVINEPEAERRTKIQEGRGLTYLFDLDKFLEEDEDDEGNKSEAAKKEFFSVDGADYGGVTRFINHSCEPNLLVHAVTHNRSDLRTYDLALFTSRKIPAGEELSFEYVRNDEWKPGDPIPEDKMKFPCYCGSKKCHGWLF